MCLKFILDFESCRQTVGVSCVNIFWEHVDFNIVSEYQTAGAIPSGLIHALVRRYDAEVFFMLGQLFSDHASENLKLQTQINFVKRYGQAIKTGEYGRTRVKYSDQLARSMEFRRWYFIELTGSMLQSVHGINS